MFKNEETNLVYSNVFGTQNAKVKGSPIYFNYGYFFVALLHPWPQIVLKFQDHFGPKSKVGSWNSLAYYSLQWLTMAIPGQHQLENPKTHHPKDSSLKAKQY